jgi:hypothetical protein
MHLFRQSNERGKLLIYIAFLPSTGWLENTAGGAFQPLLVVEELRRVYGGGRRDGNAENA